MDDAFLVGRSEAVRDLRRPDQRLADADAAVLEPIAERFAFEELHDQVRSRAAGLRELADVVERAEVGVAQRRERSRLALEAEPELRIAPAMLGQDFDRDG